MGASARRQRTPASAESMAKKQREISVSEFFAKNRHLLGFDNPRKAVLTTVKEAVDNSLDACEEAGILPDILVEIQPVKDEEDRFRVVIEDNGPGIVKAQVGKIFGKLLYGSKFHSLKQSRGQQGIGISAAGMYGQLTTGKSMKIVSRTSGRKPAHAMEVRIDTGSNKPEIFKEKDLDDWHLKRGTRVEIELEGRYLKGRQSVDEYIALTAIANPHAQLTLRTPKKGGTLEESVHPRASKELPAEAKEIRPHPHGVELGVLIQILKDSGAPSLKAALQKVFSRVSPAVADRICAAAKLNPKSRPTLIANREADALHKAIQKTRIMAPPTNCIAPIGQELILEGLKKEVDADFFSAVTRPPAVYRGNPFVIEAGLAWGGNLAGDELARVIRFANRVPLLYQPGGVRGHEGRHRDVLAQLRRAAVPRGAADRSHGHPRAHRFGLGSFYLGEQGSRRALPGDHEGDQAGRAGVRPQARQFSPATQARGGRAQEALLHREVPAPDRDRPA